MKKKLPEKNQPTTHNTVTAADTEQAATEKVSNAAQSAATEDTRGAVQSTATEKNSSAAQSTATEKASSAAQSGGVKKTVAATAHSAPGWLAFGVILLVALVSAGVSVFLWQANAQHEQQQQQLQAVVAGTVQRVDEQSSQTRSLQRELDRYNHLLSQQQQKTQQQFERLEQQLIQQQKRLRELSTTDRNDWLLAEVEYLLRLANQRLLMGKEIKGAQQLLKAADDIVKELDDQALYRVRQALAEEMAALQTAAGFDLEGVYLHIQAAAAQADQLRLLTTLALKTDPAPAQTSTTGWQQRLAHGIRAAWEKLSNYIQIRRRDERYEPVLAPEYEAGVRQNVRLMFEQAQMALLAQKQSLYEKSLGKAKHWLKKYYTLDKDAAASVIAMITELEQQQVAPPVPDISASLRELKDYMQTLHLNTSTKKPAINDEKQEKSADNTPAVIHNPSINKTPEQAI